MIGQPYVLLWSEQLNATKVQTLESCMSETRQAYADNTGGDWRLLLVGNKVDVNATAESIRPTLQSRRNARAHLPAAGSISDPNHAEAA